MPEDRAADASAVEVVGVPTSGDAVEIDFDVVEVPEGEAAAAVDAANVELVEVTDVVASAEAAKPEPVVDEVLLAAAGVARAALKEITPGSSIGEVIGHRAEEDHVLSLHFASKLRGYPGWHWTVTMARIDDSAEPSVLEIEMLPGEGALIAPDWVPWSERLAEYQLAQELAAAQAAGELVSEDDDLDDDDSDDDDESDDDDDLDDDSDDDSDLDDDDDSDEDLDLDDDVADIDEHISDDADLESAAALDTATFDADTSDTDASDDDDDDDDDDDGYEDDDEDPDDPHAEGPARRRW
ncbi:DUF3027 domain-containing protein [Herbiconiux liangxiaofengii]|uniref:DUF3027 domain-containing protein n=1 Tax=Herbiconiux liangxiaofengii TaxID=3342795 RepID=UPI0035B8DCE6